MGLPNDPPVKGTGSALYVEGFPMGPQGRHRGVDFKEL